MNRRSALVCILCAASVLVACAPEPAAAADRTPQQVIAAFKAAGLEAESAVALTPADYGFAPKLAMSGMRFQLPSLCADCVGRVLVFASEADRDKMREYNVEMGKSGAMILSHAFVRDNILVQLSGKMPAEQAARYEAALLAMK